MFVSSSKDFSCFFGDVSIFFLFFFSSLNGGTNGFPVP